MEIRRSMEPESERWGECRGKGEEERYRGRRSSSRCYCPACQLLEGKNRENWWAVAYHMSLSASFLCYSLTCSGHSLWEMDIPPPLHVGSYPYHPLLPLLFAPSRYKLPPLRQLEQVEGRPIDAGRKEWRMAGEEEKEKEETPEYPPPPSPKVRRSLQGQHTPHLSLGAREGYIERNRGERHTCPLGSSPLEEWGTNWREKGEDGRWHTCPLTFMERREMVDALEDKTWFSAI